MKNKAFFILLVCVLLLTACTKQPDITGLWESDFDNNAYFRFSTDLKVYVYEQWDSKETPDVIKNGGYRFYESNGLECFVFGHHPDRYAIDDMSVIFGTLEFVSEDHVILTVNEKCDVGWILWYTGVDVKEINFNRIE